MPLQIHHVFHPISPPSPPPSLTISSSSWPTEQSNIVGEVRRSFSLVKTASSKTANKLRNWTVRTSLEASGTTVVVGVVTEVDKDTFWPIVNAAGDKAIVLQCTLSVVDC
ncbi:hypothetical protein Hanom_Chr10g00905441 [Helianthus anomalus]